MELYNDSRISLRTIRDVDATDLARHANNRKIWENVRDLFPYPYTLADAKSFIEKIKTIYPTQNFAIALDDTLIGIVGIHPYQDVYHLTAEIGYWLGEDYWNQGIVSKVISPLVEYGFAEMKLKRIEASVFAFNTASIRVLEHNGFRLEAKMENRVYKDGRFTDELVYVTFNPDLS